MSRRNRTNDTGMNATVVVAIRRSRTAHRASVSSKIPAMAGPAADSPDQNSRFTRKTAQACVAEPAARATRKLSAPRSDEDAEHEPRLPLGSLT